MILLLVGVCLCVSVCLFVSMCAAERQREEERHLCSCVYNCEEVNVQPAIDFGKGSH